MSNSLGNLAKGVHADNLVGRELQRFRLTWREAPDGVVGTAVEHEGAGLSPCCVTLCRRPPSLQHTLSLSPLDNEDGLNASLRGHV